MRLLRWVDGIGLTLTKELPANKTPPYAILSHTWESDDDEVTYREVTEGTGKNKVGYKKIEFCAERARRDGLEYFWVDSCCIDKSNSAELHEAINSMFRWYGNASRCYVYLSDVSVTDSTENNPQFRLAWESAFRTSRWFGRGWTLQELLAPESVEFFTRNGDRLGDKKSLAQEIHEITGISAPALQGVTLSEFDIEERFKWAEKRQTTRDEDWAYCLLGIFGVFMPLIYGEGRENATQRLKEQIGAFSNRQQGIGANELKSWLRLEIAATQTNYEDAMQLRRGATGSWFLEHEVYQKWLSTEKSLLWVYGIPGSGKTILSTTVIQNLQERIIASKDQKLGIAYFYIDHRDPSKQTLRSFIHTSLDQLMRQCEACTDDIKKLQSRKASAINQDPTSQDYLMLLKSFTLHFDRVFLVIDALDESCEVEEFVDGIAEMIAKSQPATRANILITSRDQLVIRRLVEPIATLSLSLTINNGPDITRYISSEVRSRILAKKLQLRSSSLEGVIVDTLSRAADGMFLWASLQIKYICSLWSDREIIASLNQLPKGLDETYDRILMELKHKYYDQVDQLKRVLEWLTVAGDIVSLPQIAEAISLRPGDNWFDIDGVATNSENIVAPLGGLVTVHMKMNQPIARFAHKSVEEYLRSERLRDGNLADFHVDINMAHTKVAKTCLQYLSLENFKDVYGSSRNQRESKLFSLPQQYQLYTYAANYWVYHIKESKICTEDFRASVLPLLKWFVEPSGSKQLFRLWKHFVSNVKGAIPAGKNLPPVYYATLFGLDQILELGLPEDVASCKNMTFTGGYTLLHLAAMQGHATTVQRLLQSGAFINAQTSARGATPLRMAAENSHADVVDVLLQAGADPNIPNISGSTPFYGAARVGCIRAMELLRDAKADVDVKTWDNWTPLIEAIENGHLQAVELLIQWDVDLTFRTRLEFTPLEIAHGLGWREIEKVLSEAIIRKKRGLPVFRTRVGGEN